MSLTERFETLRLTYEDGATGQTADKKVKQYRSHRQCFDKTPAGGSYLPEPIRLVERDSVIDLTELPVGKRGTECRDGGIRR